MDKRSFEGHVNAFNFRELFNEMGWNHFKSEHFLAIDGEDFTLVGVAEKSGFKVYICESNGSQAFPLYPTRRKIEAQITKLYQEHLILFVDSAKTRQSWQLVVRTAGKPTKVVETHWRKGQSPELLYQRASGIFFDLDEEDKITIVDVTKRVADNFSQNNEKVTKKFYAEFKKEHTSFLKFIKGIQSQGDREWYASLMLNRLMFCYFIQKKGFLDRNKNYLRDKLNACKGKKEKVKFYSFYRDFLLVLFHKGLNESEKSPETQIEIGKIPYLNGGLFDVHEVEKSTTEIDIDDSAFERLFDFFDQYEWHLDTRHTASGKDINPDVIGYIFEKYINDRADMGAYYTKEDITDYIGKNCILPFVFEDTHRQYAQAFTQDGEIWTMVQNSGDRYIYDSVRKGTDITSLPEEIAVGLEDVSLRTEWNRTATSDFALPTEIWREVVDRRKRYHDVRRRLDAGEIQHINDFITYNLNIRQFVQDVVEQTGDPDFLRHFYKALTRVTILDPTCGSGAFLFAAMNILEPLYEGCLQRMENFVNEAPAGRHKFFEETLAQVRAPEHPNLAYYIYKSIILRNLYGVDIMKEAVEIAKLRLFLKLVATVEADYRKPNLGLEPLPDIDFNIRAGNTLVGFATEKELQKSLDFGSLDSHNKKKEIEEQCDVVAKAFARYKEIQLTYGDNFKSFKQAKEDLYSRLKSLNETLNRLLHGLTTMKSYDQWLISHQPFHWFAEFYEILHERGGFDVIIGNPPYVSMSEIKYRILLEDFNCSDLYGYVMQRCNLLLSKTSRFGFIVMHSLAFSKNFKDNRQLLKKQFNESWFSFYGRIPAGLFSGDVRVRNCIFIADRSLGSERNGYYTTRLHRWFSQSRDTLIQNLSYSEFGFSNVIPMYHNKVLSDFYENSTGKPFQNFVVKKSRHVIYYKQSAYNWISVSREHAPCFDSAGRKIEQSMVGDIFVLDDIKAEWATLFFNGKLFYSMWLTYGDEFHLTKGDLTSALVPFDKLVPLDVQELRLLYKEFYSHMVDTIQFKLNAGKRVGTYNTAKLWDITDCSDRIFLKYMCVNPDEVFEAVQSHVASTVLTVVDQDED